MSTLSCIPNTSGVCDNGRSYKHSERKENDREMFTRPIDVVEFFNFFILGENRSMILRTRLIHKTVTVSRRTD